MVSQVKHDIKARLTQSATGATGGEGSRTHVQVLANSLTASVLILLHARQLRREDLNLKGDQCWPRGSDVLIVGIVAYEHRLLLRRDTLLTLCSNYAAVAADTFSSELGILSQSKPRLITAPWRVVPPGTNGGVTPAGLWAGLAGAFIIASTSTLLLPFCKDWSFAQKLQYTMYITLAGLSGSLLDSFLGAVLQASVVDVHSGKVVEGDGGRKVLVHGHPMHFKKMAEGRSKVRKTDGKDAMANTSAVEFPLDDSVKVSQTMQKAGASGAAVADGQHSSRKVVVGRDVLDNNGVNLLMAALVSVGSMAVAAVIWSVPLGSIITR